jgi:hypothetical protein
VIKTLRHGAVAEPLRLLLAARDGGAALKLWQP